MDYIVDKNKITILRPCDFDIRHICECGQMFRFEDKMSHFAVMSSKFEAIVYKNDKKSAIIESENVKYYQKYFDLLNDYGIIKQELIKTPILKQAVDFGYGIRIAKQDLLETIISFMISANNNIGRIKRTLNLICENFGDRCDGYFAFPTLEALKQISETDFVKFGCGYRAKYLRETISHLNVDFLDRLLQMSDSDAKAELLKLKGVGDKVADCILLFGLGRKKVFPVDVWMSRVCDEHFGLEGLSRPQKAQRMCQRFDNLAGYAQQYLFYYKRSKGELK